MDNLFPPAVNKALSPVGGLALATGLGVSDDQSDGDPGAQAVPPLLGMGMSSGSNPYQEKLFDLLSNPQIDNSSKWTGFAAAMGAPTKTGSFSESLSGGLGALAKGEQTEEVLRQQYKSMMLQQLGQLSQMQMATNIFNGSADSDQPGKTGPGGKTSNMQSGIPNAVLGKAAALDRLGLKAEAAAILEPYKMNRMGAVMGEDGEYHIPSSLVNDQARQKSLETTASEAAKAPYTKIEVPQGDGTTKLMTMDEYKALKNQNPSVRGVPNFGTPTTLLNNLKTTESGTDPYAVNPKTKAMGPYQFLPDTVAMLHKQGITFNPFDEGQSRQAADQYIQQLIKQNGGDYNKAMAQYGGFKTADSSGYVGKVLSGVDLPATQSSGTTPQLGVTQAPDVAAAKNKAAEYSGELPKQIDDEANIALQGNIKLQNLQEQLKSFTPGKSAPIKQALIEWGTSLGLPLDQKAISAASSMEDFNKIGLTLATQAAKQLSSRPSQLEFQKMLEANPNIALLPEGLQKIIVFSKYNNDMALKKQQVFNEWGGQPGVDASKYRQFPGYWNQVVTKNMGNPGWLSGDASAPAKAATERTVVRTGVSGGKRVVKYSDGSIEYK